MTEKINEMTQPQPERYIALDGLRGVCALLVCILHARLLTHLYPLDFIRNAYLFVDFFFVLSGFVICATYSHKLNNFNQLGIFFIKRLGRIWPLHLLVLLGFLCLELAKWYVASHYAVDSQTSAFSGRFSIDALINNVFLIHALGMHNSLTWNNPSWSISVEFISYMSFAFICLWFLKRRIVCYVLMAIVSLAILSSVMRSNLDLTYDYGLFRCFAGFFVGVIVYRLKAVARVSLSFITASILELIAVVSVIYFVAEYGAQSWSLLAPLLFGVVVFCFAIEAGFVSQLLKAKVIQLLALLSFTMYMIHSFILTLLWRVIYLIDKGQGTYIKTVDEAHGYNQLVEFSNLYIADFILFGYLGLVVGLSYVVYQYFENPWRKRFANFAHQKFDQSNKAPKQTSLNYES